MGIQWEYSLTSTNQKEARMEEEEGKCSQNKKAQSLAQWPDLSQFFYLEPLSEEVAVSTEEGPCKAPSTHYSGSSKGPLAFTQVTVYWRKGNTRHFKAYWMQGLIWHFIPKDLMNYHDLC